MGNQESFDLRSLHSAVALVNDVGDKAAVPYHPVGLTAATAAVHRLISFLTHRPTRRVPAGSIIVPKSVLFVKIEMGAAIRFIGSARTGTALLHQVIVKQHAGRKPVVVDLHAR